MQAELLSTIKDGITAREVYQHALSYVKEKKPELEKHFVKNVGFGVSLLRFFPIGTRHYLSILQMGVEFRDSAYLLSAKNGHVLKSDMILNLGLGFADLVDNSGQK